MAITEYISKDRAKFNDTLSTWTDDALDLYIELASQWLDQNVVLDAWDALTDVPAEVQQATVQLMIKFKNLESIDPSLARYKEKLGDYEFEFGGGRSSYALWWTDLSTILNGYQLKPLQMSPQVVV